MLYIIPIIPKISPNFYNSIFTLVIKLYRKTSKQ